MQRKTAKRSPGNAWQGHTEHPKIGTSGPKSSPARAVPATTPRGLPAKDTAGIRGASPVPKVGNLGY